MHTKRMISNNIMTNLLSANRKIINPPFKISSFLADSISIHDKLRQREMLSVIEKKHDQQ